MSAEPHIACDAEPAGERCPAYDCPPGARTFTDARRPPTRLAPPKENLMTRIPITPIELSTGTITEIEWLDPNRPHTSPDERGCPDCGEDAYDSGCTADGCNGWGCQDCGTGCDLDFVSADEGGQCAAALADDDED